jgi:phosphohistidine phosphatase SixA
MLARAPSVASVATLAAGTRPRRRPTRASDGNLAAATLPPSRGSVARRAVRARASASASGDAAPLRMIILRHSDSCTEDASLKDHDRPLTAWGRSAASALCANLVDAGWADPDLVLCSASVRSRETLAEMTKVHPALRDVDTRFLGSLYAFAAMDGVTADHLKETVLAATGAVDAENRVRNAKTVMMIGHNKGWEEAAGDFTGDAVKLGVANAALLECANDDVGSWAEAFDAEAPAGWRLRDVAVHGTPQPGESRGADDGGAGGGEWEGGNPVPA